MSSQTPPPSAKRVKTSKSAKQHNNSEQMEAQDELQMLQAELARLKREIATRDNELETLQQESITLQQKKITLQQKKITLQQKNTTLQQEMAMRDLKIEKLKKEWEESSLLSVVPPIKNSPIPKLSPRGLPYYHSHPNNKEDATASEIQFCVPDIRDLNDRLGLDLGNISSALRILINSDDAGLLTYENEYDVQDIVLNVLRDAAKICNKIIVKKSLELTNPVNSSSSSSSSTTTGTRTGGYSPAPRSLVLNVRRESSIFSNVVDHMVVFDALSGAPVFIVQTKKGWNSSPRLKKNDDNGRPSTRRSRRNNGTPPTAAVLGQVYDQLSEMYAKGHPNPFGAVTCFDETYITCLDNYECRDVLENLSKEQYNDARLDRIVRNLVVVHQQPTTSSPFSPSSSPSNNDPSQDSESTQEMSAAAWNIKKNDNDAKGNGFVCHSNRTSLRSTCFTPDEIVAAFVSAILCSLDGYRKPRAIKSFTPRENIQLEALCINSTSYDWGILKTEYQGPYRLRTSWNLLRMISRPRPLYLVDHLGTGTTSKVYRALTGDGYDCVVKMYVKRQDDDRNILERDDFDKNGKAAIEGEFKKYKEIYGAELRNYVWTDKLNDLHCLIHPYFKHVEKNCRRDTLPLICERLKELFFSKDKSKYYAFDENDQLWRHIGWFNGKLYLFDLGDLKECSPDAANEMVQSHHDRLMSCLGSV